LSSGGGGVERVGWYGFPDGRGARRACLGAAGGRKDLSVGAIPSRDGERSGGGHGCAVSGRFYNPRRLPFTAETTAVLSVQLSPYMPALLFDRRSVRVRRNKTGMSCIR